MRDGTRLGLLALVAAGALGLLADLLLRALPWGLNAPLWMLALLICAGLLLWQAKLPPLGEARWLAIPALLFASGIALRDSDALLVVNVLAALLTLALAAHRAPGGWPILGGVPQYVGALISAGFHACGGILVLAFYDVRWKDVPRTGWSAIVLAALRGLLIAIPLLVVFGGLFMAADAVFSGIVRNVFSIDVAQAFSHLFWIGVWTWLAAGLLRQTLFCTLAASVSTVLSSGKGDAPAPVQGGSDEAVALEDGELSVSSRPHTEEEASRPPKPRRAGGRIGALGLVEIGIVLGLLDVLFLAFVAVQFRYLFGGAELVQVSATLTYAEYARRGFFELVAVAALLLPIVLFLDWLVRLERPRDVTIYRALAGLLVALLFVVIVSALQRMRLYTEEYGLTELRLYTTAFMLWITASTVWYLMTVLRDRRERFLFGALAAGLAVAGILNVIDPDDLIVRTNVARHQSPTGFDGAYVTTLSADAAPALIEALPVIPERQQVTIARRLLERWDASQLEDWRSWNYGRWRAYQATAANETMLREIAKLPVQRDSSTMPPAPGSATPVPPTPSPGPTDRR